MKRDITVTAERRQLRGKNEARRLRVRGFSPAVVYGAGKEAVAIAISPKEVRRVLKTGHNTIFDLAIQDGENVPVMVVDWQNDPIKDTLLHVDLKRIDLSKRITVKVPVHTTGEAKGVKLQGGLLEVVTREIEVECLPTDIPEEFTIDVSELMIGQNIRTSDIPMPELVKLVSSPDQVIAHVVSVKVEAEPVAEEVAAPAATTAEPEVIKKGKKEEEGAPAAEPKKKK
ncbi:MAG: 50S ribosomal protein L25 [Bryobacteraceae bacterium]